MPSNVEGITPLVPTAALDLINFDGGGGAHLFGSIFSGRLIHTGCSGGYCCGRTVFVCVFMVHKGHFSQCKGAAH